MRFIAKNRAVSVNRCLLFCYHILFFKESPMNRLAHCSVVTFLSLAAPAYAATIVVDDTGATPSSKVALQQLSYDNWSDMRRTGTGGNWRDFAQTFTVSSSFRLDKVSILVAQDPNFPAAGQNLKINLFSTSNINTPTGPSLLGGGETGVTPSYTRNIDNGPDTGTPGDPNDVQNRRWMTFDIADVQLTGGQIYGYRIGFNNQSSSSRLGGGDIDLGGVFLHRGNVYADGRGFRLDNNGTTPNSGFPANNDFAFILHRLVPEPSTLLLTSIGILWIANQRFRRKVR
jgi:hypothetical protein